MEDLSRILGQHPFFHGLGRDDVDLVAGCARNVVYQQDEYLVQDGEEANDFFVLRHGRIAIELEVHHQPRVVRTLDPGEVLGWSWLVPPYVWRFSARAVELTRAIALDGKCLRGKCESNTQLGYELLKRFASDIEGRLHRAWLQVGDMHASR